MLTVPSAATSSRSPWAKSTMSGTWAKTLLATTRSARPCVAAILAPVSAPRNVTSVGTPRSSARAAVLAVGSIPSEGMPMATECCSR